MLKRIVFFIVACLISLALIFIFARPVAADNPQTVDCPIPWMAPDGDFMWDLLAPGQLVENGHGFNLSCDYKIDFSDPNFAPLDQVCDWWQLWWGPGYCTPSGKNVVAQNFGWYIIYNGEFVNLGDTFLLVKPDGKLHFQAQYAPDQCSQWKSYSLTKEFPAGYWTPGEHSYTIYFKDIWGGEYSNTINFTVDENATLLNSQVRLGLYGLLPGVDSINPAQDTFMQLTMITTSDYSNYFKLEHDGIYTTFSWDGSEPELITPGPIRNSCGEMSNAWLQRAWGWAR